MPVYKHVLVPEHANAAEPVFLIWMIALASVQVQSVVVPVSWQIGTETVVLVPMKTLT